jgi:hypothetical protein
MKHGKKKPQQIKTHCSLSAEVLIVNESSACHHDPLEEMLYPGHILSGISFD